MLSPIRNTQTTSGEQMRIITTALEHLILKTILKIELVKNDELFVTLLFS